MTARAAGCTSELRGERDGGADEMRGECAAWRTNFGAPFCGAHVLRGGRGAGREGCEAHAPQGGRFSGRKCCETHDRIEYEFLVKCTIPMSPVRIAQ